MNGRPDSDLKQTIKKNENRGVEFNRPLIRASSHNNLFGCGFLYLANPRESVQLKRSLLLRVTAAATTLLLLVAAVAQDTPTFSVNVKVVNVLATVRDKQGNIVNTLGKDDFILQEDGRSQSIRYFTRETDFPLTLGLLVDVSGSQVHAIDEEKGASTAFTNDVLRADKDSSFLFQFAGEVELLQDVTKDPIKMQASLQELQTPKEEDNTMVLPGDGRHGGSGHGTRGGGTLLYDAIFLASDEMMQKQQGRKAIVVLTDGVDHGSKMSLDRAIESAQRADTMVYSIYFDGNGGGGGGGYPQPQQRDSEDGQKVLERLSKETGGRMFVVSSKNNVAQIYAQIQDELRNEYNIGYSPDRAPGDTADYRHIKLTAKQKDYTVQAREGYYASRQIDSKEAQGGQARQ
jgi:VWFA-related protein